MPAPTRGPALLWIALLLFSPDVILTEVTSSRLDIVNATTQNSGEYRCQYKNFDQSEPVHLEVFSDWLLLQSSAEVVTVGEPVFFRCHGWRNRNVFKVVYYRNGKALKYWYENHNISIARASLTDGGTYHCEGTIWRRRYASDPFNLTVNVPSKLHWIQFFIPLLVMILFIVDTGLFISTQKQFTLFLKNKRTRKGKWCPKPDLKEK
ncbi:high affinity immunoglobulin epsilon receptor subunit alpha isoform X2 [Choloepus didactylus]|uniref:high affinity immunoglobulin epsilon receptor subunit alpha isoform X2 n=1 Tax=Choloepus didactylus TaxID=27675 RepID=UPI00189D3707|nr:high affinity immunoglobulin epsilon receptor subunit alpha isoform X2 [Choloepus didactylus]